MRGYNEVNSELEEDDYDSEPLLDAGSDDELYEH